jgi:hypothetical protein
MNNGFKIKKGLSVIGSGSIVVDVQGDLELCESNEDEINSVFERIKDYTKPKGYVTGFGNWERETRDSNGRKNISVYQMLIQK